MTPASNKIILQTAIQILQDLVNLNVIEMNIDPETQQKALPNSKLVLNSIIETIATMQYNILKDFNTHLAPDSVEQDDPRFKF